MYLKLIMKFFILILIFQNITVFAGPLKPKISFWDIQQKGANIFNREVTADNIEAAKKIGIKFIRLAPDKFMTSQRDFLLGNADNYKELNKNDLKKLIGILDICHSENMPVVLTMLSLPGSRWKQNNNNQDDLRIWKESKFKLQAAKFWKDIASELKNHPAIIGYNILNEPHPERIFLSKAIHLNTINQFQVQEMLYDFYAYIIKSIRLVDKDTPIILDSSAYGDAITFGLLKAHSDKNILYSFHIYEPYEYTNHKINKGKFSYPGIIQGKYWDKKVLKQYVSAVSTFQLANNIKDTRILVGEFGGHRLSPGLDQYFQDLISIFNKKGWHFAFYAYREDAWDGMDYELGNQKLPWSYWQTIEKGQKPIVNRKGNYPAFLILKDALK